MRTRLELATPGVTGRYSNRLNYRTICQNYVAVSFPKSDAKVAPFFIFAIAVGAKIKKYFSDRRNPLLFKFVGFAFWLKIGFKMLPAVADSHKKCIFTAYFYHVKLKIMEKRIGFGPRLGAYVIDIVFVWVLAGILSRVSTSWMAVLAQQQVDGLISSNPFFAQIYTPEMLSMVVATTRISLICIFAELIYFSTEIFLGASVGKMLLGLKIANADGGNASVGALIGRYLLKHVKRACTVLSFFALAAVFNFFGSLFGFVIFIGCFFAAGDRHQALHDMMCHTIVVKKGENVEG